ncbi:MAG TPA: peroxiredoxin [Pyrinomonadaceae bacterium]|nr:peroxiredoxin [Pyrinomonadaceae bacterium]
MTREMSVSRTPKEATQVGALAPDFALRDAEGTQWRLSEKRGRPVVILFYPSDGTPTCTRQLCTVRDRWEDYRATGAEVVGISTDSEESHRSFAARHDFPFRLLADAGGEVSRLYGVRSMLPGRSQRAVFVVDAEGRIIHRNVRPLVGLVVPPKDDETIAAIKKVTTHVKESGDTSQKSE